MSTPIYLKPTELRAFLKVSESTLKRLLKYEGLPQPIRTSASENGHRRWIQSEIIDWMESKREAL